MFLEVHESSLPLIPESPGCYWLIRMMDGISPQSIGRVADTDENGILYIGQSKNLRVRFKEMLKQFNARTSEISALAKAGHPASYEWHVSSKSRAAHPLESIYYTWLFVTANG